MLKVFLTCHSNAAPTFVSSLKRTRSENYALNIKLNAAREKIKCLQEERDFLRKQLSEGKLIYCTVDVRN